VVLDDGGTLELGKEQFDHYTVLESGGVVNGDIVSIVGASGNRSAVSLTDVSSADLALSTIGMVTVPTIANNNVGRITTRGHVHELNTNGLTEGLPIYVHPTNKGKWIQTKPSKGTRVVQIGVVVVAHSTKGVIDVNPKVYFSFNDLNDVDTTATKTTPIDADSVLLFDSGTSLWKRLTWSNLKATLENTFAKLSGATFTGTINTLVIQQIVGNYTYYCASLTADTVADRREYVAIGVKYFQRCTVANATKGSGTWVTDNQISATGVNVLSKIAPASDSTTALQIMKADGVTSVLNVDTVNGRITGNIQSITPPDNAGLALVTTDNSRYNFGVLQDNYVWMQGVRPNVKYLNFSLQPSGGNVGIGYTLGAEITNNKLAVNGSGYFNGKLEQPLSTYQYTAAYPTSDTINDRRTSNVAGILIYERCSVTSATKGDATVGNWLEDMRIDANGSLFSKTAYVAKTATYQALVTDSIIECTDNTFAVTLYTAVANAGRTITIDNSGTGTITINTLLSQTINGESAITITQDQCVTLYSNGTNWRRKV
jgi:hypothetical protein